MSKYIRITAKDREKIYLLKQEQEHLYGEVNYSKIGKAIGKHGSSVKREISRNSNYLGYLPDTAQKRTEERARNKKELKLVKDKVLFNHILSKLRECWSPEQISGRLKQEGSKSYACPETIYSFIYSKQNKYELAGYLPKRKNCRTSRKGRKSKGKSNIAEIVSISKRSEAINNREEFGHWEGDLVIFSALKSANVSTIVERKSRYSILCYNANKYTDTVMDNIAKAIKKQGQKFFKSITFDRGSEFAGHVKLKIFEILIYFCHAGCPWEKGGNENFNGRLRRWLPKGRTNPKELSQEMLDKIAWRMNNIPRKILGYKTPQEVFDEQIQI